MPRHPLAIFLSGAVGTLARAELAVALVHDPRSWPWATFAANLVAAALLGWVLARTDPGSGTRSGLGAGLCGGLSTFSTFALEIVIALDHGAVALALGYAAASLAGGLILGGAMLRLGRRR